MRLSLLSAIVAGLLSAPALHEATAAPVTTAAPLINVAIPGSSFDRIYYYRGRYYPYHYRGHYFHHRYYRYGHWHYY